MLYALPDWVERAITLLPVNAASAPATIIRLSMRRSFTSFSVVGDSTVHRYFQLFGVKPHLTSAIAGNIRERRNRKARGQRKSVAR
jgi:hypothetical protein